MLLITLSLFSSLGLISVSDSGFISGCVSVFVSIPVCLSVCLCCYLYISVSNLDFVYSSLCLYPSFNSISIPSPTLSLSVFLYLCLFSLKGQLKNNVFLEIMDFFSRSERKGGYRTEILQIGDFQPHLCVPSRPHSLEHLIYLPFSDHSLVPHHPKEKTFLPCTSTNTPTATQSQ